MTKGKEEVKKIIMMNNYYLCSYSFLYSECVSLEKKKKVLNFLRFLIEKKIITKEDKSYDAISQVLTIVKDIEKEEDNNEREEVGLAVHDFRLYDKENGWTEEVNNDDFLLKVKNKRLRREIEEEERKFEEMMNEDERGDEEWKRKREELENEKKEKEDTIKKNEKLKKDNERLRKEIKDFKENDMSITTL